MTSILLQRVLVAGIVSTPESFFEVIDLCVEQYKFIPPLILVPGKYCTNVIHWISLHSADDGLFVWFQLCPEVADTAAAGFVGDRRIITGQTCMTCCVLSEKDLDQLEFENMFRGILLGVGRRANLSKSKVKAVI